MLTVGLLTRFDDTLRRAGAAVVDHWAPGLTDTEIDAIAARHGLALPEEARSLWRWHNGVQPGAPGPALGIGPDRRLLPLAEVTQHYEESAAMLNELWGVDGLWEPFLGTPMIYLDLQHATAEAVPIMVSHDYDQEPETSLPSLGDLFETWIRLIDVGAWRIRDDGHWQGDFYDRVPQDIVDLGVY